MDKGTKVGNSLQKQSKTKITMSLYTTQLTNLDQLTHNKDIADLFEHYHSLKPFISHRLRNAIKTDPSFSLPNIPRCSAQIRLTSLKNLSKLIKTRQQARTLPQIVFHYNIMKPLWMFQNPDLTAFCSFNSDTLPSPRLLEAHITIIPKEENDPTLGTNHHPISLINVDVKIYAKILANRLLPLLPSLISLDQVSFISGRESRDNTIKALNIVLLQMLNKVSVSRCRKGA